MYTQNDDDGNVQMVEEPSPDAIYTYADYLQWKWEERVELLKGIIMRMSAPGSKHQMVVGRLYLPIGTFLQRKSCFVFVAPFDVRLPVQNKKKDNQITTVVQPDLCVVCDENKIDERGCCGAPDIVIEILSPGNNKKELQYKFELYEEAGVLEYWIVAPAEELIIIWYWEKGKYAKSKPFTSGQIITTPVLPGLEINTTDIFN
ncbi:MAG: Uma2 family endonuclease [Bacteroidota bacterium]|nr:Uma2 family endonuclease [Bacteroidota bacterium]